MPAPAITNQVLALNDEIATGSNDSTLADSVRVLGLVSRMKEEASEQGAILKSALNNDLTTQGEYGVSYLRYWVDQEKGQIFCLVEAPDAGAANEVHRKAHGLVADAVYQVQEGA